jgi:hypothetical protein
MLSRSPSLIDANRSGPRVDEHDAGARPGSDRRSGTALRSSARRSPPRPRPTR